ncbi:uncharacterized protein LOC121403761 [Drosophila obscura]|uniref:uncharacterized protein LOC121403761 n=1 Tax=Drosophila obscura TaxID=7282 RepID=UPI000BA1507A|nr:uncharacterized protein LOC121403761 [Drosophila obscura]
MNAKGAAKEKMPSAPAAAVGTARIITNSKEDMREDADLSPRLRKLLSWLGRAMRIETTNGRLIIGYLASADSEANVVLTACTAYNSGADLKDIAPRFLGTTMVLGKDIQSVCIVRDEHE